MLRAQVFDMIEELNATVWATLAPSKIHGIGVFALRDIPKGQRIYLMGNSGKWYVASNWEGLLPEIKELIKQRWPYAFEVQPFQSPNDDARLTSFINHSSTPNYDHITDTAITDILKGEEITEDYGKFKPLTEQLV